jgi:DNA-binding transcriptional MerR regulator
MADIVSITGIKAHTLRKWETRYGFIEPKRTETNIRYYTDDHLRKLLNIGILTRNGYRVSNIDIMSDGQIHEIVSKILLEASPQDDINALIVSMLEMNEISFNEIMSRHITRYGLLQATTDLLYPFLNHVGVLWGTNKAMPAQEHFISNLIKQKMFSAIDAIPNKKGNLPKIVLFLMEGESHEIGLILAYYIAKELGWKVYYLGQNVPANNIKEVLDISRPNLMMTIYTILRPDSLEKNLNIILQGTNTPLAISGGRYIGDTTNSLPRTLYIENPSEFIELLNQERNIFMNN